MSLQYPIADMFTRINNARRVFRHSVDVPFSKVNTNILALLEREGYVANHTELELENNKKAIRVFLKYFQGESVIQELSCVSKPSLRIYKKFEDLGRVYGGLGIYIISTSKGVYSDRELRIMAKKEGAKLGGEIIGSVV